MIEIEIGRLTGDISAKQDIGILEEHRVCGGPCRLQRPKCLYVMTIPYNDRSGLDRKRYAIGDLDIAR